MMSHIHFPLIKAENMTTANHTFFRGTRSGSDKIFCKFLSWKKSAGRIFNSLLCFMIFGISSLLSAAAVAQTEDSPSMDTPPSVAAEQDPVAKEVEEWADRVFKEAGAEHRFSGLAIAITKGDRVVLSKGYGSSDLVSGAPVDVDQTRFRIGSTTKTFTATAIAQLYEQGKISSLDDPANKYLKRTRLEKFHGEDITLWDLLTHTAGYEDKMFGMASTENNSVPVTPEAIASFTPEIVQSRPKGQTVYSNFGISILGIIVEDITGQTLAEYLDENVFSPLGMENTELAYAPVPSEDLATAYGYIEGQPPIPLPYVPLHPFMAPAGTMNSTAADMAKYMIAHIQAGRGSSANILSAETFNLMHARHAENHPETSGFGMAFMVADYKGQKVIEHGGGWPGFQSIMMLLPDQDIGISILYTGTYGNMSSVGGEAESTRGLPPVENVKPTMSHSGLRYIILNHFIGSLDIPEQALNLDLDKYTGVYLNNRRNHSTVEKSPLLLAPQMAGVLEVEKMNDNALKIAGRGPYYAAAPDVFILDGDLTLDTSFYESEKYAFVIDDEGEVTGMVSQTNISVFEKMDGLHNPLLWNQVLLIAIAICASGALATVLLVKRTTRNRQTLLTAAFGFLTIGTAAYMTQSNLFASFLSGDKTPSLLLLILSNVTAIAAAALIVLTASNVLKKNILGGGILANVGAVHRMIVALGAVLLLIVMFQMNLIGFNMP
jgi:CubicO group peptidase (beta-lactamase class C family)